MKLIDESRLTNFKTFCLSLSFSIGLAPAPSMPINASDNSVFEGAEVECGFSNARLARSGLSR